jgi:hypothetical protein
MIYSSLNPEKALIWRIVHRDNLPWILDNGLHCASSDVQALQYVNIGNPDLIDKRRTRRVPIEPEGFLADYVPFYFTPFSVMMKNIHSGWSVQQRGNDGIVILVSSLRRVEQLGPVRLHKRTCLPGLDRLLQRSGESLRDRLVYPSAARLQT